MEPSDKQNFLAKDLIIQALLALMGQKPYSEITISEITKKAGVSRISYYRNYSSKEDIIRSYIDFAFENFMKSSLELPDKNLYSFVLRIFQYSADFHKFVLHLDQAGLTNILLERIDHFTKLCLNVNEDNMTQLYTAHMVAGALFHILVEWMKRGRKESEAQMAEIFCQLIHINFS